MKRFKNTAVRMFSVLMALILLFGALAASDVGLTSASAASWNGTNYGGGNVSGSRTFLEAFGIDYDTYMKWLDDHDADSPNPDYYLGTPYVGYDHRNPHGDCKGALGYYDKPGVEGLNCTGFVWHVLYKAAQNSGASKSQINSLPVMGQVPTTWANLGIYRIYFRTKEEALASGVLEKGDLLWIYGTKDNHNAIFYGDSPSHDLFWHSAGKNNNLAKIKSAGTFLGMWVAKVTKPDNIELHINLKAKDTGDKGKFGAKYCVFNSKADAQAAARSALSASAWDKRLGTIVTDSSGYGCFRREGAPGNASLWTNGRANTGLSYFSSPARKVSAKSTYYAVQWRAPQGEERITDVFEFKDSGKRTSAGYKRYQCKPFKKLATPQLSALESTPEGVKLSWDAVSGAEGYRVFYKNSKGSWTKFGQTTSTSFTDTVVNIGKTYIYTIRCVDSDGDYTSDYVSAGWKHTYTGIPAPEITGSESTPDGVRLTWEPIEGASRYRLYYKNSKGGWSVLGETDQTSFTDAVVNVGKTYTYTIRCLSSSGQLNSGYVSEGWKHTYTGVDTPQFSSLESSAKGVTLTWEPVQGASRYRLYYKNSKGGWSVLGETDGTSFTDELVTAGKAYTYTIRCLNSAGRLNSAYLTAGQSCVYTGVDAPQITSLQSSSQGVKLSWTPIDGVAKYRVFYLGKSGWKKLCDTSSASATDADVRVNATYTYTVRCIGAHDNYISGYNAEGFKIKYLP